MSTIKSLSRAPQGDTTSALGLVGELRSLPTCAYDYRGFPTAKPLPAGSPFPIEPSPIDAAKGDYLLATKSPYKVGVTILVVVSHTGRQSTGTCAPVEPAKSLTRFFSGDTSLPSKGEGQVENLTRKQLEHLNYLMEVSSGDDPLISRDTARKAEKAWSLVWEASGGTIPIPAACTGPDGQMLYTWDRGRHHLELEIIPGEAAVFFYKDRGTRELWGEDYSVGAPIPAEALKRFKYFI